MVWQGVDNLNCLNMLVINFHLIRKLSGNAARSSDDRGTVVTKSHQRRMSVGESPKTASSDIVFERRMA